MTTINEGGTGYSHADRQTAWDEPGLGKHSGWRNASWVDNDTVVLSDPTHLPNQRRDRRHDQRRQQGQPGQELVQRHGRRATRTRAAATSRATARKLAFATGENDSTLTLYSVPLFPTRFKDGDADPGSKPIVCYRYSGPNGGVVLDADVRARGRPRRVGRGRRHPRRDRAELRRRLHDRRRVADRGAADPRRQAARLGPGGRSRRHRRRAAAWPPRPRRRSWRRRWPRASACA